MCFMYLFILIIFILISALFNLFSCMFSYFLFLLFFYIIYIEASTRRVRVRQPNFSSAVKAFIPPVLVLGSTSFVT